MIFTLMKDKEITKKASELGYYYTSEFAIGYMMTHYPILFILDILIPAVVILGITIIFCLFR